MAETDLQSKLNRAIQKVLIEDGAGSYEDTFCEFSSDDKQIPNTIINSGGADELVLYSGTWKFPNVTVTLRDRARTEPEESNPNAAWVVALERYNQVRTALSKVGDNGEFAYMPDRLTTLGRSLAVSDLSEAGDQQALDNADMQDFTVLWWRIVSHSAPRINQDGSLFESEIQFEAHACNGNVG